MSTRNERFNWRMRRLDDGLLRKADRNGWLSDGGAGVGRLLDALDFPNVPNHSAPPLSAHEHELVRILNGIWLEFGGRGHLVRTFDLICRHGKFRDESVLELAGPVRYRSRRRIRAAQRLYERHRALLEEIYLGQ